MTTSDRREPTQAQRVQAALENVQAQMGRLPVPPRRVPADLEECRHRWHDQGADRAPACPSCGVEDAGDEQAADAEQVAHEVAASHLAFGGLA